ncbi:MAG: putative zinc-binding metallopeptidase [Bdellovibrionaceae bacterium]|nr:putative zinc-binding metallopeptidase [Bdellovibrio sp.]
MFRELFVAIALICFSFSTFAQATLEKSAYKEFPNSLNGRDFFILSASKKTIQTLGADVHDCRANIAEVMCLVGAPEVGMAPQDRPCIEGGKDYAVYFEQIYDKYPPKLQNIFCSVKRIFIENKFYGTAYAGAFKNAAGQTVGAMMGIRKSVLDQKLNLSTWASWKEQLSFGGITDSYSISPNLPQIITTTSAEVSDFLYFVVTHEVGHLLDFANGLNRLSDCKSIDGSDDLSDCEVVEGTWGSISWHRTFTPRAVNDFINRTGLCFYQCGDKPMAEQDINKTYADLSQTEFISAYASQHVWDDFADSLAYYMMEKNLNTSYVIDTKHGARYDIMWRLKSPQFAKKYQFIQKFLGDSK